MPTGSLKATKALRDDLRVAMEAVEHQIARPIPTEGWMENVDEALLVLGEKWAAHVAAMEDAGGLHQSILEQAPRLSANVDEMQRDHVDIAEMLDQIRGRLTDTAVADRTAIRRRTLLLLGRLAAHRQGGSDLIYEAYTVDLGAAG